MDIYTTDGEYKGKVFDLIVNLEKGRVETITTEALKPKSKQEAKRILSEKSIPYKKVKSAKDIIVVGPCKTEKFLKKAIDEKVLSIICESESEIDCVTES